MFDDGVGDARVWVVIGSGSAGLHKQLCVGDGGGGLDLHEHHLFEVDLHRVRAGILLLPEAPALVELKLEGESAEALLCEGIRVFVREPQAQVGPLGINAREDDLDVMSPGNDFVWVSRCDLVLEDEVISILLDVKNQKMDHDAKNKGTFKSSAQFAPDASDSL